MNNCNGIQNQNFNNDIPIPLVKNLVNGNTVIIIGSGVSISAGIISSGEICNKLYTELNKDIKEQKPDDIEKIKEINNEKNNLAKLSQIYSDYYGDNRAKHEVRELVIDSSKKADPSIFRSIAKLPICDIITTNYDRMIEESQDNHNYRIIIEIPDNGIQGNYNKNATNIFKIHGDIENPQSIILTQDDYDNYFEKHPEMLKYIERIFSENSILILGYRLNDYNIRSLMNKFKSNITKKVYWVDINHPPFAQEQWPNTQIIQNDAKEFIQKLLDKIELYHNQNPKETMNISKKAESELDSNPFKFYKTDSLKYSEYNTIAQYFVQPLDFALMIEPGTHTIIEGDRGSGKSMMLRYLALETQLALKPDESFIKEFIGFYIKMDPGLIETASKSETENEETWITFFTHFLNLLITERILDTLKLCKKKKLGLIENSNGEISLCKFINRRLLDNKMEVIKIPEILNYVRDERERMSTIDKRNMVHTRTSTRYIYDLCEILAEYSNIFDEKSFYFLLDEVDNLDTDQMKVLVLFLRSRDAPISYKIGVKTGCMKYTDPKGKILQYQDDYESFYCDRFIREKSQNLIEFFEKLSDTRLKKNGQSIKIKDLLPEAEIKEEHDYSGFKNYCLLSSGIIRSYITLVKDTIYDSYPEICQNKIEIESIPPKKQNQVIKIKSRIHFNNFSGCKNPSEVKILIEILGSLFKSILAKSEDRIQNNIKGELRTVSQIQIKDYEKLNPFLKELFIDAENNNLLQRPLTSRTTKKDSAPYIGYKFHRLLIPYFYLKLPNRFPRTIPADQMNKITDIIEGKISEKPFIEDLIKPLDFSKNSDQTPLDSREFDYGSE